MNAPYRTLRLTAFLFITVSCSTHGADQASLREPDNASRLRIASTAAAAGQLDIALSMYTAAAMAAPDDPDVQAKLASVQIRVGKPDAAEQTLTRALADRPRNPTLLRWLGNLRLETGFPEAALQIFDGLIARSNTDIASMNGRGVALDLLSRHEAAQQTYRQAQLLAPADLQTANNLAVSYLLDQHPTAARDVLAPFVHRSDVPQRVANNFSIAQAASSGAGSAGSLTNEDLQTLAAFLTSTPSATAPETAKVDSKS